MKTRLTILAILLLVLIVVSNTGLAQDDLEAIRRAAQAEASKEEVQTTEPDEVTFKSGGLGLQALNPEISVTGDFILTVRGGKDVQQETDFNFRGLGLHLESYLDPYSRFKAAVPVNEGGAELGEAYLTRYGVLNSTNITLGKFRQQFGVVNRWHKHALDWVDFPLPLRMVFGNGGLNQTGASLDWSGSTGNVSHEVTFQVTDGQNASIFGENSGNRPSVLAHYKNYRDLSANTYLELGCTGMTGWNSEWTVGADTVKDSLDAQVYGLDCAILWEPTERMRHRNVEWRTEIYSVNKDILAPDGSGDDTLNPWGVYTSLQTKLSRTVDVGTRLDYYQPDNTGYLMGTLASDEKDAYCWLTALYVTWWQSPFVKFRLEYDHQDGDGMGEPEDTVMFQCVFAAGPHKHERY